ncbi:GNAT family N-acetyltransferase [Mesorhizobium sp. M0118]|uniref:GNAT family N-acetyltransferase n=1 Tax=Mesorhizobium sp. M0118 TaxID=2956884 RepID=UPI003338AE95
MDPNIEIREQPDEADRQVILDGLNAYNLGMAGPYHYEPVAVLIKDPATGHTIGGLWARCNYDWLFIELLFVPEHFRGQKIGARLVSSAEQWALGQACIGVWLDTYEFQAPAFYQSLGYEIFGHLPHHPRGFGRYFLRKIFAAGA